MNLPLKVPLPSGWILLIVVASASIIGCSTNSDKNPSPLNHPALCWVEAVGFERGMYSGSFGDIILYDLATQERRQLTDDSYFDESPSISPDRKRIAFGSLRVPGTERAGLGAPGRIHYVDLSTGDITGPDLVTRLGRRSPLLMSAVSIRQPSYARHSNRIAFDGYEYLRARDCVYIYEVDRDTVIVLDSAKATPSSIVWSDRDDRLFFDDTRDYGYVIAYDLFSRNIDTTWSSNGGEIVPCDFRDDSLLCVMRDRVDRHTWIWSIVTISMKTKKEDVVYTGSTALGIRSAQYGPGNTVYCLMQPYQEPRYSIWDVYQYDRISHTLTRITNDLKHKEGLRYFAGQP